MNLDFAPLWLTLRISFITTPILFLICVPLGFRLTRTRSALRFPIQALLNLPLALPPTVIGFYLLLFFSPDWIPGHFLMSWFHLTIPFSQMGLVIGSMVFSLPFMINPIVSGLDSLPASLSEEARMLGASPWQTLFHVLLPEMKPSLLAAAVLTFSHTIGEFGVALMIGGKIPGRTLLASMAVYDEVESMHYGAAHFYSAALCALSFGALLLLFLVNKKGFRPI